jgi:dTMP kinase
VGRLIVIEGLDGAGKRTLTDRLTAALTAQGARVARLAFPRYDADVHAELVRDALYGRLGDLSDSVHGMALLFALDRRAAVPELRAALREHDVLLVDRYVASNAAYGAARLHQDAGGGFVDWVRALEIDRFGLPVPDRQLLLAVPPAVARSSPTTRCSGAPRPCTRNSSPPDGSVRGPRSTRRPTPIRTTWPLGCSGELGLTPAAAGCHA